MIDPFSEKGENNWQYTEEELEWFLREYPRHADRRIVERELKKLQDKRESEAALQREQKRQSQQSIQHREIRKDNRWMIGLAALGIGVAIGLWIAQSLCNKRTANPLPDTTKTMNSTFPPSQSQSLPPTSPPKILSSDSPTPEISPTPPPPQK